MKNHLQKCLQSETSSPPSPVSGSNRSTTSSRPVRSVKMSATGSGGCGPGPGPTSGSGSGASNPRKFSEKIALHTQRQAEETAAFQEVMMDITSTRVSLRRRQEEESCPEEERPCPGSPGTNVALPAPSVWRHVCNCCTRGEQQRNASKCPACVVVRDRLLSPVLHFRYVASAVSER